MGVADYHNTIGRLVCVDVSAGGSARVEGKS